MVILAHGVDLVELNSLRRFVAMDDWLARTFVGEEISQFPEGENRLAHIAGRFAAKEAVLKALGTGFGNGISFTDIVVSRRDGEQPKITLKEGALLAAAKKGISAWHLSITHTSDLAMASVVGETGQ